MYTCPECGSHKVKVSKWVPVIEYWNGDDVEPGEDYTHDRAPREGTIECLECGNEGVLCFGDEWVGKES